MSPDEQPSTEDPGPRTSPERAEAGATAAPFAEPRDARGSDVPEKREPGMPSHAGHHYADQDDAAPAAESHVERDVALLDPSDTERFRERWNDVQVGFVDDPREAVGTADALVTELMQALAARFAEHRNELEAHWNRGDAADTEELRLALQRYRSFFHRLLETS